MKQINMVAYKINKMVIDLDLYLNKSNLANHSSTPGDTKYVNLDVGRAWRPETGCTLYTGRSRKLSDHIVITRNHAHLFHS